MRFKNFTGIKYFLFNNTTVKQTIVKNTFWLSIGTGVNKLFGLILLIYVARILGVTEYGKFSFALAFISLFVIFHDFGLSTVITREYAREEDKSREEFYSIISLKIFLSVAAFAIILFSSFFVTPDPQTRYVILILALFSLFNSFNAIFYAVFYARQKMEYQTWLESLQYLLISVFCFFILFRFPSVENLSYGYLMASFVSFVSVLIFFNKKIFNLKIYWDSSVWRKFLIMSWPLALTGGLFGVLYGYIDSVMMGSRGMITETGWYNAAYRIIFITFIPMGLISASFYPVLSKFFKDSKEKLQKVWDHQLELMILSSLPLMVGGIVLAPRIIHFFYPSSFSSSVLALQILMIMAGFIFLSRPFFDVMIASNQQKYTFLITIFGVSVNILLNLFLIPRYSLYGAAVSTAITHCTILLISMWISTRLTPIKISYLKFLNIFASAGISSALMYFLIIQPVIYNLNIFLSITIGASIYFLSFFILKMTIGPIYDFLLRRNSAIVQ